MTTTNTMTTNAPSPTSFTTFSSFTSSSSNLTCINAVRIDTPPEDCDFFIKLFLAIFVLSILLIIFGLFTNSVLLYIIFSNGRAMRTIPNIFIANMAILDTIFLLVVAGAESVVLSQIAFQVKFSKDPIGDKIIFNIQIFIGVASFTTLAIITIDRYLSIVHPFRSRPYRTKRRAFLACGLVWIIAGLCMIPIAVSGSNPNLLKWADNPSFKTSLISFAIVSYFIPLVAIIVCYCIILNVVWWNPTSVHFTNEEQKRRIKQRIQVSKTVAIVVGLFVVHYGYFFAVLLWIADGGFRYASPRLSNALLYSALLSVYIVTGINPVVYALHQPGFRPHVYKLLCSPRCKCDISKENSLRTNTDPSAEGTEMSVMSRQNNESRDGRNLSEVNADSTNSTHRGEINSGFQT